MSIYTDSPYKKIPQELLSKYTMNGKIPVIERFYNSKTALETGIWDDTYINSFITKNTPENIINNNGRGNYGPIPIVHMLKSFEKYSIRNKNIAVIGSANPWVESILLNLNNFITTVEYNPPIINSKYNLSACSYNEFQQSNKKYDAIVSYSSIEHSGLGRYGDSLDPDGDLIAMNDIYTHLKSDGFLFLGVPIGPEVLAWNAHRIYGKHRWSLLIDKFNDIEYFHDLSKDELLSLTLQPNERLGYTHGGGKGEPVVVLNIKE